MHERAETADCHDAGFLRVVPQDLLTQAREHVRRLEAIDRRYGATRHDATLPDRLAQRYRRERRRVELRLTRVHLHMTDVVLADLTSADCRRG